MNSLWLTKTINRAKATIKHFRWEFLGSCSSSPKVSIPSAINVSSPGPVKGKYSCADDLLHKVGPAECPACKSRLMYSSLSRRPRSRRIAWSSSLPQGIVYLRQIQTCSCINAMPKKPSIIRVRCNRHSCHLVNLCFSTFSTFPLLTLIIRIV